MRYVTAIFNMVVITHGSTGIIPYKEQCQYKRYYLISDVSVFHLGRCKDKGNRPLKNTRIWVFPKKIMELPLHPIYRNI